MREFIVRLAESGQPMRAIPVTPAAAETISARCADIVRLIAEDSRAAIEQAMAMVKNEIQYSLDWLSTLPLRLSIPLRHLRSGRSSAPLPRLAM